ncbi:hypothetical protein [Ferdinandcohnia sp. Marseille-Q9671]
MMYFIHYYENRSHVLTQFVQRVPIVDEDIKIKGRKGKVTSVTAIDDKNIQIHVALDRIQKGKKLIDDKKKKRR